MNPFLKWMGTMSKSEVARLLGVSHASVRRWVDGKSAPGDDLKLKIVKISDGAVSLEDIVKWSAWHIKLGTKSTRR